MVFEGLHPIYDEKAHGFLKPESPKQSLFVGGFWVLKARFSRDGVGGGGGGGGEVA